MADRICSIEGCGKNHKANGLCNTHNERRRAGNDLLPAIRQYKRGERLCKIEGCGKPRACSADLCGMHYYRPRKRLNRYGLTHETFLQMLEDQGARCAVCRTDEPSSIGWCVDHDHVTGRVRGILCDSCNQGIGRLRDDPLLVAAALRYLTAT